MTAPKVAAKTAPVVHAVPVEHQVKPLKPIDPATLPVRPGEDPWTAAELDEIKDVLVEDIARFESQIEISTAELVGLLRDGTEGAGRDPADVGSANFERDAEMSLANNAREMLDQSRLALRHIELGTYGSCDNCGQPIGKGRLQAFPRATLCVTCKQREERR
jgi:RNA polymerase-binding transcription factor